MMRRTLLGSACALALAGCAAGPAALAPAAPMLAQEGNPVHAEMTEYVRWLSKEADRAAALAADR